MMLGIDPTILGLDYHKWKKGANKNHTALIIFTNLKS